MGIFRQIQTEYWQDPDVQGWTPEERYFYLYLLTNPATKQCGIYEITLRTMCFDTGYNDETILKLIKRFEGYGKLQYSRETNEIALKNWRKHHDATSSKVQACIKSELENVKNRVLIDYLYPIDTQSQEEKEKEKEKEEEKEEEGEKSETASVPDPSRPSKTSSEVKPKKHRYGTFSNVTLTTEEHQKILENPDGQAAIDHLSNYRAMKGYSAKSDYLALLNWVFDAVLEQRQKKARLSGAPPRGSNIDQMLEDIKAGKV